MKKNFLLFMIAVSLAASLSGGFEASEIQVTNGQTTAEKAIRDTLIGHRRAVLLMEPEKMLTFCTGDYQEAAGNGTFRSRSEIERVAKHFAIVRTSDDLEAVLENALLMQNQVMSDRQRQEVRRETEKSGKETIAMIRGNIKLLLQKSSVLVNNIQISDIRINGDNAFAEVKVVDPEAGKIFLSGCHLRLERGKWLVYKVDPGIVKAI